MASTDPTADDFVYEEFAYLHENVAEHDLDTSAADLPVARRQVVLPDGRDLSVLVWGGDPPQLAFVHGTGQNAHTWDTVVLALGRPAVAVDLAGHGHSSWRDDRAYDPRNLADDVAVALAELAPDCAAVIGMSLGGLVVTALAARHPQLVHRLLLVDVTPGVTREKAQHIHEFIEGPPDFPSFADILERTVKYNPTRSVSSLRRGIVHNANAAPTDRGVGATTAVAGPTTPPPSTGQCCGTTWRPYRPASRCCWPGAAPRGVWSMTPTWTS